MLIHPQTKLIREPRLMAPGQKPVGAVKVDRSHYAASSLKFGHLFRPTDPNLDIVKSIPISWTGSARTFSVDNVVVNGNTYVGAPSMDAMGLANPDITILVGKYNYNTGNNATHLGFIGASTRVYVYWNIYGGDTIYWDYDNGGDGRLTVASTYTAGTIDWFAFVARGGVKSEIWRNGSKIASKTISSSRTTADATATAYFGRGSDSSGTIGLRGLFMFNTTNLDHGSLTRDPYQFLIPA